VIQIGVIGYGYWGPNLVRNFSETPGARVARVSDLRDERLRLVQARYPAVEVTKDHRQLIDDPRVDAVVIATPVSTHFDLAMLALKAGKHVLVEKPLAASGEQVERLIDAADKANLTLMVDHTFVYTGAVRKIRELMDDGSLGELYYYDSTRVNLGLFQHDVNVIWDLGVHDLSIMDYVLPTSPVAVSATGLSHLAGGIENIAFMTLFFEGKQIAHLHLNWLAPVKVRRTLIGASNRMIVYDDLEFSEKIKVYDKGINIDRQEDQPEKIYEVLVGYRTGDMLAPKLDSAEALRVEAAHFIRCLEGHERPLTDGHAGLRVVQVLEAATESMRRRGRPVELPSAREPRGKRSLVHGS
jgi:predicted dehydrogenase